MGYTGYQLAQLFFTYSFLGWIAETAVATAMHKDFRNRGFASSPFCFIYGFSGVFLTVTLWELKDNPFCLFLGCVLISTMIEWVTGKWLERIKQKKWWDYSNIKWNFNGYICLPYSILWGALGSLVILIFNDLFTWLYDFIPAIVTRIVIWLLTGVAVLDLGVSMFTVYRIKYPDHFLIHWKRRLGQWTYRFGAGIAHHIERRLVRAYPAVGTQAAGTEKYTNLMQLFWLFLIGGFLGDLVETVFCRFSMGRWMSRSGVVWGPFSIVWGLAIVLATALLYRDRNKPVWMIFLFGTFWGGAYEYICSVFTELVFGTVFWDYSKYRFNLGGRINLLFCFFWGIAAVVWIKLCYPKIIVLIDKIIKRTGKILTVALLVFMIANVSVTILAWLRYDARLAGNAAEHAWERIMDERFDDARMKRIFPNAKPR